mmetsp:Transcript_22145/g.50719  ORF Transcript_22145/g.50719 Transcript_22145/m.50719 type:complete len:207 (+) Transcript_22145:786-1406(+)
MSRMFTMRGSPDLRSYGSRCVLGNFLSIRDRYAMARARRSTSSRDLPPQSFLTVKTETYRVAGAGAPGDDPVPVGLSRGLTSPTLGRDGAECTSSRLSPDAAGRPAPLPTVLGTLIWSMLPATVGWSTSSSDLLRRIAMSLWLPPSRSSSAPPRRPADRPDVTAANLRAASNRARRSRVTTSSRRGPYGAYWSGRSAPPPGRTLRR